MGFLYKEQGAKPITSRRVQIN
ncbi:hypothetical protein N7281_04405 [Rickettsia hoogstraalii]|nr:hypothetical protein [Rickettsia hoogstraalii]MCX4084093.1 hypothetical protein [Rickettsia hoogstraalii]